jgi:glycosyltransferase involved in cell wall biosynthesis
VVRELAIEVIIPVQNMADQLDKCLSPLVSQCGPDDVVTVVDDASTDKTGDVAADLGARVIHVQKSAGPYHARQLAANASQADVLLFVDGRCRPLDGLLDSHRRMQSQSGILLSATETRTRSGTALAARASARLRIFALSNFVGIDGRPDYYPTANLGIQRAAFHQVGGFRTMRSGADADICWRIQQFAPGSMAVDRETLMEWEPRTSVRDLLSQAYRYGKSYAHLEWVFDGSIAHIHVPIKEMVASPAGRIRSRLRQLDGASPPEKAICFAYTLAFDIGYARANRRQYEFTIPSHYDPVPR